MTQEELNQMAGQMQAMQQQAQAVAGQLESMQQSTDEIYAALDTLKNFKAANGRVLLPIGAGVYASAKAVDTQKVLVNIGAGIVDERPVADAIAILEGRVKIISDAIKKGQEGMAQLNGRMEILDKSARKMVNEMNANVRPASGETD